MMLPKGFLRSVYSLAIVAMLLTLILYYLPQFSNDFLGQFLSNWITLVAFFIATYWTVILQRRTVL